MKIDKKELKKTKEKAQEYNPMKKKIKFKFSLSTLNMFIGYIYSDSPLISKMNLMNLQKLIDLTDTHQYELNRELYTRLNFISRSLEGKLSRGLASRDILTSYAKEDNNDISDKIIRNIDRYTQLNDEEIKYITKAVSDRLQYSYILVYKEMISNAFYRMDTGEYTYIGDMVNELKGICTEMMNDIRKSSIKNANKTFSLQDDIMDSLVEETIYDAINPSTVLKTGIALLNEMLSPGYMAGRLYIYLGITGGWKSAMLLSTCYWIKKYNRIKPKIKGRRPTILYISNENTIQESIVRLFNMSSSKEDITNFKPEDALKLMRERGGLTLNDEEDIDIVMQYYGNFEISTADLYGIIEDLEDNNREVICLVLDYIKRIRPAQRSMDERGQLANASNELKDLAVRLRIPVITAQQINRAGNMTVDAAMESGKEDLARFLGRSNIANCWDMLENCDWAAILNVEVERRTSIRYLTIKEIKKRYKSTSQIDYFNQPFVEGSTIQLVEDVNFDKPVGKYSLASDLVGINMKAEEKEKKHSKFSDKINAKALQKDPFEEFATKSL